MSWGSAATEGASTAGASAGSAASNTASSAGSVGSGVTQSAGSAPAFDTSAAGGVGGYGIDATDTGAGAGSGVNMTASQSADMASYGEANPSYMDKAMSGLEKFQKGGEQSLPEAWRDRAWDNPATYGYVAGKVQGMAGGGGGNQPANVTTNISYQQPQNDYLRRRRGY